MNVLEDKLFMISSGLLEDDYMQGKTPAEFLCIGEGRVKIISALIAKKTVSCEVHSQGCLLGMFPLSVGGVCLCVCVCARTCLHVEVGIKLLTCC